MNTMTYSCHSQFISIQVGEVLCGCILGILYYMILHLLEHGEVGLFDCKIIANAFLRQCGFLTPSDIRWCNKL